ncbi:MAG TPA: hypothetical protein V6D28_31230 [Leptolyngbyaceae cyanobacterium]
MKFLKLLRTSQKSEETTAVLTSFSGSGRANLIWRETWNASLVDRSNIATLGPL